MGGGDVGGGDVGGGDVGGGGVIAVSKRGAGGGCCAATAVTMTAIASTSILAAKPIPRIKISTFGTGAIRCCRGRPQ